MHMYVERSRRQLPQVQTQVQAQTQTYCCFSLSKRSLFFLLYVLLTMMWLVRMATKERVDGDSIDDTTITTTGINGVKNNDALVVADFRSRPFRLNISYSLSGSYVSGNYGSNGNYVNGNLGSNNGNNNVKNNGNFVGSGGKNGSSGVVVGEFWNVKRVEVDQNRKAKLIRLKKMRTQSNVEAVDAIEKYIEEQLEALQKVLKYQRTIRKYDTLKHCLINVHGFPHSGTGMMLLTLVSSFPKNDIAYMQHPRLLRQLFNGGWNGSEIFKAYAEGILLQDLYPRSRERSVGSCAQLYNRNFTVAEIQMFCPDLLHPSFVTKKKQLLLWKYWSQYWRPDRFLVAQKSPTFDAAFLSKMFPGSSNLFTMRHPMIFRASYTFCSLFDLVPCSIVWLQTWQLVFRQILSGQIPNYLIARYEDAILSPTELKQEINVWERSICSSYRSTDSENTQVRRRLKRRSLRGRRHSKRRLEIRMNAVVAPELMFSTKFEAILDGRRRKYKEIFELVEPAAQLFGYSVMNNSALYTPSFRMSQTQNILSVSSSLNPLSVEELKRIHNVISNVLSNIQIYVLARKISKSETSLKNSVILLQNYDPQLEWLEPQE